MVYEEVVLALDNALPDEKIVKDVRDILYKARQGEHVLIELEEGPLLVPLDTPVTIVTKACFKEYFDLPFGAYKVQVAIGGVTTHKSQLRAVYCFAVLYYTEQTQVQSIDVHPELR